MADLRMRDVHRIRFSDISYSIRTQLAQFLDVGIDANWEMLAESLGVSPHRTNWMKARVPYVPMGSPTLLFFNEYCTASDISLSQLVQALFRIKNFACIRVLSLEYGEATILSALPAEIAYPDGSMLQRENEEIYLSEQNKFGFKNQPSTMATAPAVSPSVPPPADIWARVSDIGNNFDKLKYEASWPERAKPVFPPLPTQAVPLDTMDDYSPNGNHTTLDLRRPPQRDIRAIDANECTGYDLKLHDRKFDNSNVPYDVADRQMAAASLLKPPHTNDQKYARTISWLEHQNVANEPRDDVVDSVSDNEQRDCRGSLLPTPQDSPPQRCGSLPVQETTAVRKNEKHVTHPFSDRDVLMLQELDLNKQMNRATTMTDVQHSAYTVDNRHVRVFVTYTDDSKSHRRNVLRMCECLKENHFSVSLDVRETHLLTEGSEVAQWHDARYNAADYVLVLVSSVYRRVVEGNPSPSDTEAARNAAHIYRRMLYEFSHVSGSTRRHRFIAVVMPGSSKSDVPKWLLDSSAPVYTWPTEYLNLFYCMMRPATVVTDFVLRREHEIGASCLNGGRSAGRGGGAERKS